MFQLMSTFAANIHVHYGIQYFPTNIHTYVRIYLKFICLPLFV